MRVIVLATVLAAALGSSASAQRGDYRHHSYCLKTGSGQECAFDSFEQCQAAKRGANDTCMQNSAPQNH